MTYNSRLAQELGKWAEDQGQGDVFHEAVFWEYFERGENIARHDILRNICSSIGLDPAIAQNVLEKRSYKDAVDRDWERCRKMRITAVPTFVMDGKRLVGAQPYLRLERMVADAMDKNSK